MTVLTFAFTVSSGIALPNIRFKVDNRDLGHQQLAVGESTAMLSLSVTDGEHVIEIERYGKLDQHGDQSVTLDDIYIEDVRLPAWVKSSGQFHYNDTVVDSGLIWYPNGRYLLTVQTPVINWIVDERIRRWGEIPSLFAPTLAQRQQLTDILNNFEQALQDVKV